MGVRKVFQRYVFYLSSLCSMCVNVMLMLAGQDDSSSDSSDSCDASDDKYSSLTVEEAAILCDQQEKKCKANNQC